MRPNGRTGQIRRRELLVVLGSSALLLRPLAPFAQGKVWVVGVLTAAPRPQSLEEGTTGSLLRGMRDLGHVEGKSFVFEWRFAGGQYERLPALAAELIDRKVDIIVAWPSPAIRAAQQATTTIPIVMASTGDPVGAGFVASLARPGGNITGLSNAGPEISVKHLQLLMSVVPNLSRVALLGNPGSTSLGTYRKNVEASAREAKVDVVLMEVRTPDDVDRAFASMPRERIGGVIIAADSFIGTRAAQIAQLAIKYRLPSIYGGSRYAGAGGLLSYARRAGGENNSRAATYVDKIMKGAKPADLPVELPTNFDLVVNRKTAKLLGLAIPQSFLVRADRVID